MRSRLRPASTADSGHVQIVLRPDELGLRLLPVLQRARLAFVETAVAPLDDRRQVELRAGLVQRGGGGKEIILRLHDLRAVDLEQRGAAR